MNLKEIESKLEELHKKGCELSNEIEEHQNGVVSKRKEYEDTLKHISALINAKIKIQTLGKELAKFEPKEKSAK